MRNALAIAGVAFALVAQAQPAAHAARDAEWSLRVPKEEKVLYRGMPSLDGASAGSMGNALYPATNLATLFAAVITHAVVADELQARQRQQLQDKADRVLVPYQSVLDTYRYKELMQRGLAKVPGGSLRSLLEPDAKPQNGWLVESAPVFAMTQDQRALVLDNALAFTAPGAAEPAYQVMVRVVSQPQLREDLVTFWTAKEGEALKEESAVLFARSLELAFVDPATAVENVAQKTFRYMEGSSERMERAELVSEHCDRLIVRTLRGWLLSIPSRRPAEECPSKP